MRRLMGLLMAGILLAGCAAPIRTEFNPDLERIRKDTHAICNDLGIRATGTEQETLTADWIEGKLREAGFVDDTHLRRMPFEGAAGQYSENIVAICNPDSKGPIFSVVAHYDSVATSLGARDNAASVAGLLEIARFFGNKNPEFDCQIRMVFLGSEENGYHGSKAYVQMQTVEEKERHAGAFNMDISAASESDGAQLVCNTLGAVTEGEYREGNFIIPAEGRLTEAMAQAYRQLYGKELGGIFHFGESDHVSFHNAQMEAVNVCWRRVSDGQPVLPQSYHKMEDTPEELDYETIRATIRCIVGAIEILTA